MAWPLSGSPNSRETFKQYCLRRLGKPVIEINISDEQADDRIDDALKFWTDYHLEGSEKVYYKYALQPVDFTNKWIPLPANIIGAVSIFDIGTDFGTNNMFNIRYQIALNDLYTLTSVSMIPYYMAFQQLQFIEQLLVGKQPIRYNRYRDKLYIDADWTRFEVGNFLIVEAYQVVDPDELTQAWGDRFLQMYATALIKRQWGENLKKFGNMTMPGGITFNGQQIYNEAIEEIEKIEHDVIHSYSMPVTDMIG